MKYYFPTTRVIICARTIKRLPLEQQADTELLLKLKGTPLQPLGDTKDDTTLILPPEILTQQQFTTGNTKRQRTNETTTRTCTTCTSKTVYRECTRCDADFCKDCYYTHKPCNNDKTTAQHLISDDVDNDIDAMIDDYQPSTAISRSQPSQPPQPLQQLPQQSTVDDMDVDSTGQATSTSTG